MAPHSKDNRPNVLYLMADQMNARVMPMYNDKSTIKMPHIDGLAKNGVVFDSAYTNSPLCAPARFTLCTGRLPSKIGGFDNASSLGSDIPTYAHGMRNQGYHTALSGKMHFIGPDQQHGFEQRLTSDIYPSDFGWSADWRYPNVRLDWYHDMSSVKDAGPCATSNQLDYDEEVVYQAKKYIWKRARFHRDQPWCLTVSLTHPHDPYAAKQEFWDMYEGVDIPMPQIDIKQEDQDPHSKRLLQVMDLAGKSLTEDEVRRARRGYAANISYVDSKVGELLEVLKQADLLDNTIIVFSGDHGDMAGERGLWYKMNYFEDSARVPLLFHFPAKWEHRRVKESVSTMDLFPTFVEMVEGSSSLEADAGIYMEGRSLCKHLIGEGGHDEVIGEYFGEGTISPLFMIRRGPWKFIYCDVDPAMLFNIDEDPFELRNLAQVGGHEDLQILNSFLDEVKIRWDVDRLRKEVMDCQARRRYVASALRKGDVTHWDHQPIWRANEEFIRNVSNQGILLNAEEHARFPPVRPLE